jgi:hypothetical protein
VAKKKFYRIIKVCFDLAIPASCSRDTLLDELKAVKFKGGAKLVDQPFLEIADITERYSNQGGVWDCNGKDIPLVI